MARIQAPINEADLELWLTTRPQVIREMVQKAPPDRLYRIDSGHRVTIYSYHVDGTVTVVVSAQYNFVVHERRVFGIPIEQLAECDLPAEGEPVGSVLTCQEVIAAIEQGTTKEERMTAVFEAARLKLLRLGTDPERVTVIIRGG